MTDLVLGNVLQPPDLILGHLEQLLGLAETGGGSAMAQTLVSRPHLSSCLWELLLDFMVFTIRLTFCVCFSATSSWALRVLMI